MSNTTGPATGDTGIDFKMWYYTPSLPAAVIASIIFGVLTIYHMVQLFRTRSWFCIPFVIGGIFEIIGYAARGAAHNDTTSKNPYIIQTLLLLIAPPLFAASIYMILGRIVRATQAQSYSIIRVTWLTKIFVAGDVTCFLLQAGGGGIQASAGGNPSTFKTGEDVVLGGLVLQIVVFGVFLVVAGIFHNRLRQRPTTASSASAGLPWERLMWIMYTVSVLITVRNIVRVAEYAMGADGYLLTHEWTLYVFDGLLMALVLLISLVWYHSDIKPRRKSLESDGAHHQGFEPKTAGV